MKTSLLLQSLPKSSKLSSSLVTVNNQQQNQARRIFPNPTLDQVSTRIITNQNQDMRRQIIKDLKLQLKQVKDQAQSQTKSKQCTLVYQQINRESFNNNSSNQSHFTSGRNLFKDLEIKPSSSNSIQTDNTTQQSGRLMFSKQETLTQSNGKFVTPKKRNFLADQKTQSTDIQSILSKRSRNVQQSEEQLTDSPSYQNQGFKRIKVYDYFRKQTQNFPNSSRQNLESRFQQTNSQSGRDLNNMRTGNDAEQINTSINLLESPTREGAVLRNIMRTQNERAILFSKLRSGNQR